MNKDSVATKRDVDVVKSSAELIDSALGGYVSRVKNALAEINQGFFEAKFDNLILDVISGDVSQEELNDFIKSASGEKREFISNLILKNIQSDNRLSTFLLAKLWIQKIKNEKLNYYEQSLFSNINYFSKYDYEIFYEILQKAKMNSENEYYISEEELEEDYCETAIAKFKNIGLMKEINIQMVFGGASTARYFLKSSYTDTFSDYLKEYFENNQS